MCGGRAVSVSTAASGGILGIRLGRGTDRLRRAWFSTTRQVCAPRPGDFCTVWRSRGSAEERREDAIPAYVLLIRTKQVMTLEEIAAIGNAVGAEAILVVSAGTRRRTLVGPDIQCTISEASNGRMVVQSASKMSDLRARSLPAGNDVCEQRVPRCERLPRFNQIRVLYVMSRRHGVSSVIQCSADYLFAET